MACKVCSPTGTLAWHKYVYTQRLPSVTVSRLAIQTPMVGAALAAQDARCDFKPMELQRRPLGENDVLIESMFCGVCHSDLHFAANHLKACPKRTAPIQTHTSPARHLRHKSPPALSKCPEHHPVSPPEYAGFTADRVPMRARPRARGHMCRRRRRSDEIQKGRPRGRWLHGRFLSQLQKLQAGRRAKVFAAGTNVPGQRYIRPRRHLSKVSSRHLNRAPGRGAMSMACLWVCLSAYVYGVCLWRVSLLCVSSFMCASFVSPHASDSS